MPLLVNLNNGETRTFDLEKDKDAKDWAELKLTGHEKIRGVSVKLGPVLHVLPMPRDRFSQLRWDGELIFHRDGSGRVIGERATLYVDELAASILAYRGKRPQMVKYTLERTGRPVFQADPFKAAEGAPDGTR